MWSHPCYWSHSTLSWWQVLGKACSKELEGLHGWEETVLSCCDCTRAPAVQPPTSTHSSPSWMSQMTIVSSADLSSLTAGSLEVLSLVCRGRIAVGRGHIPGGHSHQCWLSVCQQWLPPASSAVSYLPGNWWSTDRWQGIVLECAVPFLQFSAIQRVFHVFLCEFFPSSTQLLVPIHFVGSLIPSIHWGQIFIHQSSEQICPHNQPTETFYLATFHF